MKKSIVVMLALLMATGCANNMPASQNDPEHSTDNSVSSGIIAETGEISSEPFWDFVGDIGEKIDTISFTKDMGDYSVNVFIDVHEVIGSDIYQLIMDENSINIQDSGGNIVSSTRFSNPYIAGAPTTDRVSDYKGLTVEVLEMNTGNLLVVGVPQGKSRVLSIYYFDDKLICDIRREDVCGGFNPFIDGEITVDGDTFTVNEYVGLEREKRTVTYSVDFENVMLKEIAAETNDTLHDIQYSINYVGIVGDVVFRQPMGGYSANVCIQFLYNEESDNYTMMTAPDQIHIKNSDGEIVSSIAFNNPYIGGSLTIDNYEDITPEVLRFDSGNLLIVRVPAGFGEDAGAQCLSVFYYDDSYVNYIGKQEYGGDFFPLIDGEITVDGDTFTVNEYVGSERVKRTVTYSVDFENILIKEVTE